MFGVAIRIGQRMGIHNESTLAKCTALEAEMRRRLWWSLILFDARIGEMADFKAATLTPTWDCRIPLNVNDSDFRTDMKVPPHVQGQSTEALFAVVRGELADFVRHSMFHLDFTNPALKPIARNAQHGPVPEGSELNNLEKLMEDKYLKFCDSESPLHFMTILTARAYIARCRLAEFHSRYSSSSVQPTEVQRDAAMSYALRMLECDTKIRTSPLTKGFHWLVNCYFPMIAYIQIGQSLKQRPLSDHAEQAWEVMSDNYESTFGLVRVDDNVMLQLFSKIVLQAWEAREETLRQSGESLVPPRIVLSVRHKAAQRAQNAQNPGTSQPTDPRDTAINDFPMSMPVGLGNHNLLYSMEGQDDDAGTGLRSYHDIPELAPLDVGVNQLDWSAMDWDLVNAPAGEAGESTGLLLP